MVLEKVINILAEYKECDPSEIHEDSTFEELELDSLDTVDLMMSFEDEFGIQMEMSEDMKTVGGPSVYGARRAGSCGERNFFLRAWPLSAQTAEVRHSRRGSLFQRKE